MEIWFNKNFKLGHSSNKFKRVLISIDDIGGSFGCINDGVSVRNVSFPDSTTKTIHGVGSPSINFDGFAADWDLLDKNEKEHFSELILSLSRSFRYHVQQMSIKKRSISSVDQSKVFSYIADIREKFENLVNGTFKEEKKEEWIAIEDLDPDSFNNILEALVASPSQQAVVNDILYRLYKNNEGGVEHYCLQYKGVADKDSKTIPEKKEEKKPAKVIKTKKMAFMVDDKDLFNFNRNELYEIHGTKENFTCLTDVFGEKHYVLTSRFKVIEVEQELSSI